MKHIECAGSNPSIFTAVYCVVICALLAREKPYPCMQGHAAFFCITCRRDIQKRTPAPPIVLECKVLSQWRG